MYKFLFIYCLSLLIGVTSVSAQKTDAMLFGDVKSSTTGEHIPHAVIEVKGTKLKTVADASGHFTLANLPLGKQVIMVSAMSYKPQSKTVMMERGKGVELYFSLDDDELDLNQVVVTGTRTQHFVKDVPIRTEVITSAALRNKNANSLYEALMGVPGIRVEQQCQFCNFSMVRMQGLGAEHTQVLIDGEPVYSGLAGVYGLDQMGTNDVDRIEVVKGAGSALYGSSAVAGAINLISKEPSFTPSLKVDYQAGNFGFQNFNASGSIRKDNIGITLFAQHRQNDPIDQTADGLTRKEVKQKDSISDGVAEKLTNLGFGVYFYNPFTDNDKLVIRGKMIREERAGGLLANDTYLNPFTEGTENILTNRLSSELVYTLPLNGGRELNVAAAYVHHKRNATNDTFLTSYMDTHDGESPDVQDMRPYLATENTFTPSVTFTQKIANHTLLAGIQSSFSKLKETGLYAVTDNASPYYGKDYTSIGHKYATEIGLFVQDEWLVNKHFTVVPGVRIDSHQSGESYEASEKVFDGNFPKTEFKETGVNPRIALKYQLNEHFTLRANFGTGFRAPYGFSEDLHLCSGSPRIWKSSNLKSEKSMSFNLSADYYGSWFTVSANIFRTNLKNKIDFSDADENVRKLGYTYQWENVDDAYVQGVELSAKVNVMKDLNAGINLTFNQGKYYHERKDWVDTEYASISKYIPRFPNTTGDFQIEYTPKTWTFTLSSSLQGKMYIDYYMDDETPTKIKETSPFMLFNCRVAKKLGDHFTLYAGGKNILSYIQDEKHTDNAAFMYAPVYGASWYGGITISL